MFNQSCCMPNPKIPTRPADERLVFRPTAAHKIGTSNSNETERFIKNTYFFSPLSAFVSQVRLKIAPAMNVMTVSQEGSVSPSLRRRPSTSKRIRQAFLNKLGIDQQRAQAKPAPQSSARRSLLGRVRVTLEPLKYKEYNPPQHRWNPLARLFGGDSANEVPKSQQQEVTPSAASDTSSVNSDKSAKRLTFQEQVKVVPIPRRDEYSDRVKERLWTSTQEIHLNAQRNTLEYQSEGWDWRTALEDENMYTCAETGELIHPVHCEPYFGQNQ